MTNFTDVFGSATVPPSEEAYAAYALTENTALVWPFQYSSLSTGVLFASIMAISIAPAGVSVSLPDASVVSVGKDMLIVNTGASSFDVVTSTSSAVTTVAPGETKYIYLTDNSTATGVWGVFTFGTGTSSADASMLAGSGLEANSGRMRFNVAYKSISVNYSVLTTDRAKLLEVISGSVTLTLPLASSAGDGYAIFVRNSSAGSTVVDGNGTEQVDDGLTKTLAPGESAIFICNGTYWMTVGFGRDVSFVFSEFVVDMALGSVVLTSDQVAGKMIRLAGVAAGNVTVTLPNVDNIYFVNVESGLGGFQATFTTGSGTTVSLTSSVRTALYSDGTNISTAISTAVTSVVLLDDGSATVPSLRFALDTDTGIFRPASNTMGFSAGGTEVVDISDTGVSIDYSSAAPALKVTQAGTGGVLLLQDTSDPDSTPVFVDNLGRVVIGNTAIINSVDQNNVTNPGTLQQVGSGVATASFNSLIFVDNGNAGEMTFSKSRNATLGGHTIVQNGDRLGVLQGNGSDGVKFVPGAQIRFSVDGAPGVDDMPGRIVFLTTPDGSNTPTEKARITQDGKLHLGTTSGSGLLNVAGVGDFIDGVSLGSDTHPGFTAVNINGANGAFREIFWQTAGLNRWKLGASLTTETGSNTGSDFRLIRCDDTGAQIGFPFVVWRDTGNISLGTGTSDGTHKVNITGTQQNMLKVMNTDSSVTAGVTISGERTGNGNDSSILDLSNRDSGAGTNTDTAIARIAAERQGVDGLDLRFLTGVGLSPTEAMRINTSQLIGMGRTTITTAKLAIQRPATAGVGALTLYNSDGVTITARSDSGGRWLVGSNDALTTRLTTANVVPVSQIIGDSANNAAFGMFGAGASVLPQFFLSRANGTPSAPTIVTSGSSLGRMSFVGHDGVQYTESSRIDAQVDSAPAAGSIPGRLLFMTAPSGSASPTERMRVDSTGNVLIGTTTAVDPTANTTAGFTQNGSANYLALARNGAPLLVHRTTSDGQAVQFYRNMVQVGNISVTTTATAYNTSSDYRLKENIEPITGAIDRVMLLSPSRFNFKIEPNTRVDGFIAHEAQAVVPEAVQGLKDEVDEDGNPVYQSIDQAKLVPLLTAALQEAVQAIEDMKIRILTLENRI